MRMKIILLCEHMCQVCVFQAVLPSDIYLSKRGVPGKYIQPKLKILMSLPFNSLELWLIKALRACNYLRPQTNSPFCFIPGGKTNQLNLQNTATKAIIQGLLPEQNYTVQLIAYHKDKESKPAQGQFRSVYWQSLSTSRGSGLKILDARGRCLRFLPSSKRCLEVFRFPV